jgi:hypothetical protein
VSIQSSFYQCCSYTVFQKVVIRLNIFWWNFAGGVPKADVHSDFKISIKAVGF